MTIIVTELPEEKKEAVKIEPITEPEKLLNEGKKPCSECGTETKLSKLETHGNMSLCSDCKDDFIVCRECNRFVKSDDSYSDDRDSQYCEDCFNDCCATCEHCERSYNTDDDYGRVISDSYVCERCINRLYVTCNYCEAYVLSEEALSCDNCGYAYCEGCGLRCDCADEFESSNPSSHPSVGTKDGKYIHSSRLFGVEIEAEEGDRNNITGVPSLCGIEEDGSLDETGVEVVTNPVSKDAGEKTVKEICKALSNAGFTGTRACGLHVHLDAHDILDKPETLSHVLKTVYAVEDLLFSMMPSSRWSNHYCMRLSREYKFNSFDDGVTMEGFESQWYRTTSTGEIERRKTYKYDNTRYCALNLHSVMYRGTIEFRHHAGTINADKILQWVSIVQSIVDYAVSDYNEKDVARLYNTPTTNGKLREFFKIMKIKRPVQKYIKDRIAKFNPDFKNTVTDEAEGEI